MEWKIEDKGDIWFGTMLTTDSKTEYMGSAKEEGKEGIGYNGPRTGLMYAKGQGISVEERDNNKRSKCKKKECMS